MMKIIEINIFLDNDSCWLLNFIKKTIPIFYKNRIKIKNIWILPDKLSNLQGLQIPLWYLRIFGFYITLKLLFFYIAVMILNIYHNSRSFKKISRKYKINVENIESFNDQKIKRYFRREKKIEYYNFIFTNHLVPKKLLILKNVFFINKHASLLPSCRGLLPFIRTKIFNLSNGVTIHLVNQKIDNGLILYQKKFNKKFSSMIDFYLYVFDLTPKILLISINNLKNKKFCTSKYRSSFYTLPSKKEFKKFLDCGGNIININDFLKINKLMK